MVKSQDLASQSTADSLEIDRFEDHHYHHHHHSLSSDRTLLQVMTSAFVRISGCPLRNLMETQPTSEKYNYSSTSEVTVTQAVRYVVLICWKYSWARSISFDWCHNNSP